MKGVRVIGVVLVGLSGTATVGLALGVLGLAVYFGYQWLGIPGGLLAFWLGGTLAFGIVNLAMLPIRALGVALMVFGEKERPDQLDRDSVSMPTNTFRRAISPARATTPLPSPSPGSPSHTPHVPTGRAADEVTVEAKDRLRLERVSYNELRSRLPPLPPAVRQRRVEVTEQTFIVWDLMEPWGVTAVALLKGGDGECTVWTPGHLTDWVWRGPRYITRDNAELLGTWLTKGDNHAPNTTRLRTPQHAEVADKVIWLWDPDPDREGGLGLLRLNDGGFQLSFMMAGLKRGGAYMGSTDGDLLAQWLIQA